MAALRRCARVAALLACMAAGSAQAQFMRCEPLTPDQKTMAEFCSAHLSCAIAVKLMESCAQISAFIQKFFAESKGKSQEELARQPVPEPEAAPREPTPYESPAQRLQRRQAAVNRYVQEDAALAAEMRNLNCGAPRSIDAQRCADIGVQALDLHQRAESYNGVARLGGAPDQNPLVPPLTTVGMVSRDSGNFIVYPSTAPAPLRRSGGAADLAGAVQKAAQEAPEAQRVQEQEAAIRRANSVQLEAEEADRKRREAQAAEARRRQAELAAQAEAQRRRDEAAASASAGGNFDSGGGSAAGGGGSFGAGAGNGMLTTGNYALSGNCSGDIESVGNDFQAIQRRGAGDRSPVSHMQFAMYQISNYVILLERSCRGRPEHAEIPMWRSKFDEVKRTCLQVASSAGVCVPRVPW